MENASEKIVQAVADREGKRPTELGLPLYEFIDPDALDELLEEEDVEVSLEYLGYEISAHSSGDVRAEPIEMLSSPL